MDTTARDEAVRRLREESARRRQRAGSSAVASRCLLGAVLSLAVFAAREAREAREDLPPPPAAAVAAPAAPDPAVARERDHREVCLKLAATADQLNGLAYRQLADAHGEKQRARTWIDMQARHAHLAGLAADHACPLSPLTPQPPPHVVSGGRPSCGCVPCGGSR
jgi:hypothetical protein